MTQAEFESCQVQLDVFDANTVMRNVLIGKSRAAVRVSPHLVTDQRVCTACEIRERHR